MEAITWPEFASLHPFAPPTAQTTGIRQVIADLEGWLAAITGYDRVSSSRMPAARANTPVCSRSGTTISIVVTTTATPASSRRAPTAPTLPPR